MASPIDHMTVLQSCKEPMRSKRMTSKTWPHWSLQRWRPALACMSSTRVPSPSWKDIESAIRRMDNSRPIVWLSTTPTDLENPDLFCVAGGAGRWTLYRHRGQWTYTNPDTNKATTISLFETDKSYSCAMRHLVTDIGQVLQIVRVYFESGSYASLNALK